MSSSSEKLCNNCSARADIAAPVALPAVPAALPAVPAALPAVPKKPIEDIRCLLHDILGITNSFAWRKTFFGLNAYGQKCIVIETETGDGWERDCYLDGDDRENIHQMIDDYRSHQWSSDEVDYPCADITCYKFF